MRNFVDEKQKKLYYAASFANALLHAGIFVLLILMTLFTNLVVYARGFSGMLAQAIIFLAIAGAFLYFSYLMMSVQIEKFRNSSLIAANLDKGKQSDSALDYGTTYMNEDRA